jgi:hypothetical protein
MYNPLIYGTWLLRNTNNLNVKGSINYLIINNDETIKFKSLNYNQFYGNKMSRTAVLNNIVKYDNNTYTITFNYFKKNTYAYSFLGIEIPEIKTKSEEYFNQKNLTVNIFNNILLIIDNDLSLYYIFDLYYGKIKYPYTETHLNTFLFTQIFGIIIGLIINKLFD